MNTESRSILLMTVLLSFAVVSTASSTATVAGSSPDFTISPEFSNVTVQQSYSQKTDSVGFNVILTSINRFAGTVLVSDTAPPGFTVSGPPYNVTLASGATVKPSIAISSTVVGTYNVTITGTSESLVHSTQIKVTVTPAPPDFSVSISPRSMNLQAGSSGNLTVTASNLLGFSGTVSLIVCINNPVPPCSVSGVTGSASPSIIALTQGGTATSSILIHTSPSATTGDYAIWIDANAGSITHQAAADVGVGPYFTITASPNNLTVPAGSTTSSTLLLTSHANFAFTANFQLLVSIPGPQCPPFCPQYPTDTISPSTVNLSPLGTGTAALTVSTNATTTLGDYTLTIYGGGCVCVLPALTMSLTITDPSLSVGGMIVPANIWGFSIPYTGTTLLILGGALVTALVVRLRQRFRP